MIKMETEYLVALVLACLVVIGLLIWLGRQKDRFAPRRLLTKNEEEFFGRLEKALPDHYIFPQVAFRAFLEPAAKPGSKANLRQRGRIGAKHCDFLICNRKLDILAIIELDDRTHVAEKDRARDEMTGSAGYLTIRYESRCRPAIAEIRDDFRRLLEAS